MPPTLIKEHRQRGLVVQGMVLDEAEQRDVSLSAIHMAESEATTLDVNWRGLREFPGWANS